MKKPKPVHVETVCSVCGLDWDRHGDDPTADRCIELLRADLAKEKQRMTPLPALPQSYPVPYPVPYRPWSPYPGTNPYPMTTNPIWTVSGTSDTTGVTGSNFTFAAINASSVSH